MEEELKHEQVLNQLEPLNPLNLAEGPELQISTGNITKSEIRDVLKSLKNGKAQLDLITSQLKSLRQEDILYQSTSYMAS